MDLISSFHFLRPWWLLIALPPLVVAALAFRRGQVSDQWKGVIAPHLLGHLLSRPGQSPWLSPEVLLLPFALLLAVAMAGPSYRLADTPEGPDDTTLLFVVDLSSSMAGRDVGPSRIGRLRLKLRDLINLRRGARIGLIAVAGSAHVVMPPTDDGDALLPFVDVLAPELMPEDGERFAQAAALVRGLLPEEKGPTVVVVAGDSIPPEGARSLLELQSLGVSLVGWPVGTDDGRTAEGTPGLDREGFRQLERGGAEVVELSLSGADLRRIDSLLDRARTASADPKNASLWEDSGYGLVLLVAPGVLFWFRKGWVLGRLGAALLVLSLVGCAPGPTPGSATGGQVRSTSFWSDLFWTRDQQGRRLFEQKRYIEAAEAFEDPMWKGIAYYTGHDWKSAQEQFSRLDTTAGLFNLANAHAQAKEIASAISVYDRVLSREPTHRAARTNRDYLQGVLDKLEQTSDFEDLGRPSDEPPDRTKADLRPDQREGPKDFAAEAADRKDQQKVTFLSDAETDQWMKRVNTNPADFLRAKFSIQEARSAPEEVP